MMVYCSTQALGIKIWPASNHGVSIVWTVYPGRRTRVLTLGLLDGLEDANAPDLMAHTADWRPGWVRAVQAFTGFLSFVPHPGCGPSFFLGHDNPLVVLK